MPQRTEKLLEAILQKLQDDHLRAVSWAQEQLGHGTVAATYRWLKKHGVPVIAGRIKESVFYGAWDPEPYSARQHVDRVMSRRSGLRAAPQGEIRRRRRGGR